ncbi:MAG: hypothetical protein KDA52_11570 [Planctomycetaceae bacterium]|nr:hypothetical protein [Planctomycetaceae bacterium]
MRIKPIYVLSIVATGVVAWIGWSVVSGARTSVQAEYCLHSCILATAVLEEHVKRTEGRWPASWDELPTTVPSVESGSMYDWPEDIDTIKKYVAIDFGADPAELAQSSTESFSALQPIGPCYLSYDRHFEFLIASLREFHPTALE